MGMVESRWVPRSSKSVAGRSASRGGFDSHPSPPVIPMDYDIVQITKQIKSLFHINNMENGSNKKKFLVRYTGTCINANSEKAFQEISETLKPLALMAILRETDREQELIVLSTAQPRFKLHPLVNILMFALTVISVLFTGGLYSYQGALDLSTGNWVWEIIKSGWPFAISMLAILSAHEFGHFFAGKLNDVDVSLPLFIPFPFSTFGTMGAIINMRSLPQNKKVLFDIAFAGPICGFIISVMVLLIGFRLSETGLIPQQVNAIQGLQMEGNSLLYLLLKYIFFGKVLPHPSGLQGLSLIFFWGRFFFTGLPFPWGAEDVMLHPVAWAGWAGLFITAINLIPAGQLDGGHIFQALAGEKAMRGILPFLIGGLSILGIFWNGWWMWSILLFFTGRAIAQPLDQITSLDQTRRILGFLALFIFLITFIPVPITIAGM